MIDTLKSFGMNLLISSCGIAVLVAAIVPMVFIAGFAAHSAGWRAGLLAIAYLVVLIASAKTGIEKL